MGDRTPVAVGQIRRDPRRPDRCVRVVEVGVSACAYPDRKAARVEEVTRVIGAWVPYEDGRRTRIRLDRLERWEVVDG